MTWRGMRQAFLRKSETLAPLESDRAIDVLDDLARHASGPAPS